ncbi:hypothetical protein Droror1_Dr00019923 [Drosera rotundifolia]
MPPSSLFFTTIGFHSSRCSHLRSSDSLEELDEMKKRLKEETTILHNEKNNDAEGLMESLSNGVAPMGCRGAADEMGSGIA